MIRTQECDGVPVMQQLNDKLDSCEIRPITVDEFVALERHAELIEEYAAESSIEGMPKPQWQTDMYRMLEGTGAFYALGAFQQGQLIGFMTMLVNIVPHYGLKVATAESIFVGSAYRSSGAGMMMMHKAELLAKDLGAVGMLISAPYGGRLAKVAPRMGYRQTNEVFFKGLK